MAILWADFPSNQKGLYGLTESYMLNGIYATISSTGVGQAILNNDPDPNIGSNGYVFETHNNGNSIQGRHYIRWVLPTERATAGFSCRLQMDSLFTNNDSGPFIEFANPSNSTICAFRVLNTGAVQIGSTYQDGGTQYGVTTGPVIVANAYNHIEVKPTIGAGTGA